MKKILVCLAAALASGCASAPGPSRETRTAQANEFIRGWSAPARVTAAKLIDEYGPPDRTAPDLLVWDRRGPWKRTVVHDDGLGVVEQTLDYPVWDDKRRELFKAFPDKILYPGTPGELTARNLSENLNFLTFNLADEIITGDIEPEEARKAYDRAVDLAASGKSTIYMQGLLFMPK